MPALSNTEFAIFHNPIWLFRVEAIGSPTGGAREGADNSEWKGGREDV